VLCVSAIFGASNCLWLNYLSMPMILISSNKCNCHFFTDWLSPRASDHIVGVYALRNAVPNVGGDEHRNIVMKKINKVQLLLHNRWNANPFLVRCSIMIIILITFGECAKWKSWITERTSYLLKLLKYALYDTLCQNIPSASLGKGREGNCPGG